MTGPVDSGFFVLRTPLLSFDALLHLGEGLEAAAAAYLRDPPPDALAGLVESDASRVRDRLRGWLARSDIREALYLASPAFEAEVGRWLRSAEGARDRKRDQKVERAAIRYFCRMAGRDTPLGLFGHCSVGKIGPETRLDLPTPRRLQRQVALNRGYLETLTAALESDPDFRKTLTYSPNSTLREGVEELRFLAPNSGVSDGRVEAWRTADLSDAIREVVACARRGAPWSSLSAAAQRAAPDADPTELETFLHRLIDQRILESDLPPPLTGGAPLSHLRAKLKAHPPFHAWSLLLEQVEEKLDALGTQPIGVAPEAYQAVVRKLEVLPAPLQTDRLFEVTPSPDAPEISFSRSLVIRLRRAIESLRRIALPPPDRLRRFRDALDERCPGGEIPLLEALDSDDGLDWEEADSPAVRTDENPQDSVRFALLEKAWRSGGHQVELTDRDLRALEVSHPAPLPTAFSAFVSLAQDPSSTNRTELVLNSVSGPSGAEVLSRFCHADTPLRECVQAHLRAEEKLNRHSAFAELVYAPPGRLADIAARPVLRRHEIPIVSRSGACLEGQLPLDDLTVSVDGERIVLRSRRLGCEVTPRLTAPHGPGVGIRVFRFLRTVAEQGAHRFLSWSWGTLENARFLPRIKLGGVTVSKARWKLGRSELDRFKDGDPTRWVSEMGRLRRELGLPRWVVTVEEERRALPIDLDNAPCLGAFLHKARSRPLVLLEELLPHPERLGVRGSGERYFHQIIVPFTREPSPLATARPAVPDRQPRARKVPRTFVPGSEWLCLKIYSGPTTAERLLREVWWPLIHHANRAGWIRGWFFVRYRDPDWHLRIRFRGEPSLLLERLLPAATEALSPWVSKRAVRRLQIDTYQREIERYGGAEAIAIAERLFEADSRFALSLFASVPDRPLSPEQRLSLCVRGTSALLEDFGFGLIDRRALCERLRIDRSRVLDLDATHLRRLRNRYPPAPWPGTPEGELQHVVRRSTEMAPWLNALRTLEVARRLSTSWDALFQSLVHMQVNRMMASSHLEFEWLLYDLLERRYRAEMANSQSPPAAPNESTTTR